MKILMVGGGTGGHVYPGLAVREALPSGLSCAWVGKAGGIEQRIIRGHGIPFLSIPAGKLRRYVSFKNVIDIFRVIAGFFAALRILRVLRPHLVFSKGGFVSVPVVFAAKCCGITVMSHESDVRPGLATRLNAHFSKWICTSWQGTRRFLGKRYHHRVLCTGNPLRRAICEQENVVSSGTPQIFVVGGSLGSQQINMLIEAILEPLLETYRVVHQHGREYQCRIQHENYFPFPFLDKEYASFCASSTLLVCRAGAGTLSELAYLGKTAILIPLRSNTRGEQIDNAHVLTAHGAAEMLLDPSPSLLLSTIQRLVQDPVTRHRMEHAMRDFHLGHAAQDIAALIREEVSEYI